MHVMKQMLLEERVVQYSQTESIRLRQFANRLTGSRFAVK